MAGLGMSHRLGNSGFNSALGVLLEYPMHNSGGWSHVSGVFSLGGGSEGPYLSHHPKKKKDSICKVIHLHISQSKSCLSGHPQSHFMTLSPFLLSLVVFIHEKFLTN
jgi:hypothetical protein